MQKENCKCLRNFQANGKPLLSPASLVPRQHHGGEGECHCNFGLRGLKFALVLLSFKNYQNCFWITVLRIKFSGLQLPRGDQWKFSTALCHVASGWLEISGAWLDLHVLGLCWPLFLKCEIPSIKHTVHV